MQERRNSSALAMELRHSWTKPSTCAVIHNVAYSTVITCRPWIKLWTHQCHPSPSRPSYGVPLVSTYIFRRKVTCGFLCLKYVFLSSLECHDGRTEDSSGWTEDGERVSASLEGHELQWENQGTHWEVHPGNGISQNQKSGMGVLLIWNLSTYKFICVFHLQVS